MASRSIEMTAGQIESMSLRDGARGVIQVDYGNTTVSLYGSLNDINYILIETYSSASALKEVALCKYMAFFAGTNATRTKAEIVDGGTFGTTKAYINETK